MKVRLRAPFQTGVACTGDRVQEFICLVEEDQVHMLTGAPHNFIPEPLVEAPAEAVPGLPEEPADEGEVPEAPGPEPRKKTRR